jgi:hypothetical protein
VCSVAQQGRGWPHSDGDGAPAGLTSLFDPAESREEGSRVRPTPLRGRGALAVQEWVAQRREAAPASSHSPPQWWGWAPPRELAEQRRGVIPRRAVARSCCVRALNARTHVREQVRAGRTSSEADPARGGREPSSEVDPTRGGREPSSETNPTRGGALLCRFGGPRGPLRCGSCCECFALGLRLALRFAFFAGFKLDSPRFFRGPSWLSPTNPS